MSVGDRGSTSDADRTASRSSADSDFTPEVRAIYRRELSRHSAAILEALSGSASFESIVIEVARRTHTVKGSSGMAGDHRLCEISRAFEELLEAWRTDSTRFDRTLLHALGLHYRNLLDAAADGSADPDADRTVAGMLANAGFPPSDDSTQREASADDESADSQPATVDTWTRWFRRAIRRTADELGKPVVDDVDIVSEVIDLMVLDALAEPIVHLIRNAVDHGIESAERRTAVGKSPVGRVRVSAAMEPDFALVSVSDDGGGLDRRRILATAVDRGLVPPHLAEAMTDAQTDRLVFRTSFTTRNRVTTVSGRGLGLDIVRERVERLGGSVAVDSEPNRGTCVTLRIPVRG